MRPELDLRLCTDFPLTFRDRRLPPERSAMAWGFPSDGWYWLVREVAQVMEPLLERWYREATPAQVAAGAPRAVQVKEKFGGLRFYVRDTTPEIDAVLQPVIVEVEARSPEVCIECGARRLRGSRCTGLHPEADGGGLACGPFGFTCDRSGRWVGGPMALPAPPHHAELPPRLMCELLEAADRDFEVALVGGELMWEPGPVSRLRWRAGKMLDWLSGSGELERRVVSNTFPVDALLPPVRVPLDGRPQPRAAEERRLLRRDERLRRAFGAELPRAIATRGRLSEPGDE